MIVEAGGLGHGVRSDGLRISRTLAWQRRAMDEVLDRRRLRSHPDENASSS